ncbi:MAG: 50S ribosomal protein L10 [Candidatus Omnitrophota bacterium]
MKFGRVCKEYMMQELARKLEAGKDIFVTDFSGLESGVLQGLRKDLKKTSASYAVIKNSIGKAALKKRGYETLAPMIDGNIGLVIVKDDPAGTSKILVDFSRKNEAFSIKGGFLEGAVCGESVIRELALLPSREVLLAMVCGTMQSPITGFVNVLAGTLKSLLYAMNAIKDKKSEGGNDV